MAYLAYEVQPVPHPVKAPSHAFDALPQPVEVLERADGRAVVVVTESVERVVREFYESYQEGDLDRTWERYVAIDVINHAFDGAYDRKAWREADKSFVAAFPNLDVQVLDQVADGDKVATRYEMTGTQSGAYVGIPASGVTATLTATSWDRIADGKIAEHWVTADVAGLIQQLTSAGE